MGVLIFPPVTDFYGFIWKVEKGKSGTLNKIDKKKIARGIDRFYSVLKKKKKKKNQSLRIKAFALKLNFYLENENSTKEESSLDESLEFPGNNIPRRKEMISKRLSLESHATAWSLTNGWRTNFFFIFFFGREKKSFEGIK